MAPLGHGPLNVPLMMMIIDWLTELIDHHHHLPRSTTLQNSELVFSSLDPSELFNSLGHNELFSSLDHSDLFISLDHSELFCSLDPSE